MNKYGQVVGNADENNEFGQYNPQDAIIWLILDMGYKDKRHRKNFFNPNFGATGIASGPHLSNVWEVCIDYAEKYREKNGDLVSLYDAGELQSLYNAGWGDVAQAYLMWVIIIILMWLI